MSDNTELRDRLAVLCGWKKRGVVWYDISGDWPNHGYHEHPFPDGDLTSLAAAWPEGWWLEVAGCSTPGDNGKFGYVAAGHDESCDADSAWIVVENECLTEYDARLRLTVAVLEAMQ